MFSANVKEGLPARLIRSQFLCGSKVSLVLKQFISNGDPHEVIVFNTNMVTALPTVRGASMSW